MKYSKADIAQWLLGALVVNSVQGNEINAPCPMCNHASFYFNVKKEVGYCHRASCAETFTIAKLIDIIGHSPELAGYVPAMHKPNITLKELTLPEDAEPVLVGHCAARQALQTRGVTWKLIQKFNIHQSRTHIIVPIYEEGELVQYNSRRINRNLPYNQWFTHLPLGSMKYKYAKGYPIANYFLGWDECRLWDRIVLVENTFVSMWLRDLNCTATFGSHLSNAHVDKIVHSKIKHVTMLWDEGANAQKAQRTLKSVGVPNFKIDLIGQPDDYTKDEIRELIK